MKLTVNKTEKLEGEIVIPGSKSHTIRAVVFASLAEGASKIKNPLESADTMAAVGACRELGANINTDNKEEWVVEGFAHAPKNPGKVLDCMNSGTSTNLVAGIVAALCDFEVEIDGDDSLRTRPMQPLLRSFNELGAEAWSMNNNGNPPIKIKGKMLGGKTKISGINSQYVSSLLIACSLLEEDSEIEVHDAKELPYVRMTLKWLDELGIKYKANETLTHFKVQGRQRYKPFEKTVAADWSSAAFPLVGAAMTNSNVLLKGLDINDVQGDKAIIDYLKKMGADVSFEKEGIRIKGRQLKGCELDLSDTPDALPALSVLGAFAQGTTTLVNVAQARIKETDRIKVMREELSKLGVDIKEREEGLIIHHSPLKGNKVRGHADHRIVMALSLAGLVADGKTEITTAESVSVTYPTFVESMKKIGAQFELK